MWDNDRRDAPAGRELSPTERRTELLTAHICSGTDVLTVTAEPDVKKPRKEIITPN